MQTRILRVFGVAMLLLGTVLVVSPVGSIPITAGSNDIEITQVVINDNGTVLTQNVSVPVVPSTQLAPGSTYRPGPDPANLVSVTVNDGGIRVLDEFNQSRISVTNVGFPAGINTGIWVVENNVLTAFGNAGFADAVERSLPSSDLRDYLEYDFPNIDPTTWGADFDFMFDYPLLNDDYLMIVERDGNTFFDLQALDQNGNVIAGAVINSDAPYRWNTGILPGDTPYGLYQPQWITVLDVEMFGVNTDVTPIHGFRINNDGQADVKFLGLSDVPFEIAVELEKTVYAGHNSGASCNGSETASGLVVGDDVTWCFEVLNDGLTRLNDLQLTDGFLGITNSTSEAVASGSLPLAPGATITYYVEATAPLVDTTNTASISAQPIDGVGVDYGVARVEDTNTAAVDIIAPSISMDKTVYAGHSGPGGAGCTTATNSVSSLLSGDDLTWCFRVVNDGDTRLNSLQLSDALLGLTASTSMSVVSGSTPLDPGEVITYFVQATAPAADVTNTATISATPVDVSNNPTGSAVDDTDTASVQVIDPSVSLEKTIYGGHDSGVGCPTAVDSATLVVSSDVTWCFEVENTGTTILDSLTLSDALLSLSGESGMSILTGSLPLGVGQTIVYYVEAATPAADTTNSATISGVPVDTGGTPVSSTVTSTDTADVVVIGPAMTLAKTIYAGHDSGIGCPGGELVANVPEGANLTWCFVVTNTGDTRLGSIVLSDVLLGIPGTVTPIVLAGTTPLEIGASISYYVAASAPAADQMNSATVSATPIDGGGASIGVPIEVTDTASVDVIAPSLSVDKTVIAGHDSGASCPLALNEVIVDDRADITYCFTVTNTGSTHLRLVSLADPLLGGDVPLLLSADSTPLAPGDSAYYYVEDVAEALGLTTVNVVTASAQPSTSGGVTLPVPRVDDTDTATIRYQSTLSGLVADTAGNPIAGVTIELRDFAGTLIDSATTSGDGTYVFAGLGAGTYSITELQPGGYGTVSEHAGSVGGDDTVSNVISSIVLPAATDGVDYDFVESSSSIAGVVWADADNDGVRAATENPIGGVTIELLDGSGAVMATMQTNSQGRYSFGGLPSGTYSVRETQPVGIADGSEVVGSEGGDASINDIISNIVLGVGVTATGYDFGERSNPVSGTIWLDTDRDGLLDSTETGRFDGVVIQLLSSSGVVVDTTTSDANGFYQFDHVSIGDYVIREVQPSGVASTTSNELPVTVPSGGVVDQNFGEIRGSLGGTLWADADGDGIRGASEILLDGLTVELLDASGQVVATTTSLSGIYLFRNLDSGTYRVRVLPGRGSALTSQDAGSNDELDSDVDAVGVTEQITLGAGEDRRFIDAGIVGENRDLAVNISVNRSTVVKGESVTYTVTAANVGNIVVGQTDLVVVIPNLITISKVIPEPGWTCTTSGQKISCHSDVAVNPGDKLPTIQVLGVSTGSGSVRATSAISTPDGPETTLANNADSVPVRVNTKTLPVTGSATKVLLAFGLGALVLGLALGRVRKLFLKGSAAS